MVPERLLEKRLVKVGERLVLVFGAPLGVPGKTNSIRLHEVEEAVPE
jgi:pyruvate kinase